MPPCSKVCSFADETCAQTSFLGDNEKEEGERRKKGFISSWIYCGQEQWKKKNKEKDKKEIGMAGGEDDRYAADLLDSPPLPRSRSSRRRSEDNSARDGTPVDVSDGRENGSHRYREVRTFKCKTKNLLYLKAGRPCEILLFCFPSPD